MPYCPAVLVESSRPPGAAAESLLAAAIKVESFVSKCAGRTVAEGSASNKMDTSLAAAAGPSVQEVAATQSSEPSVDLTIHPSGIVPVLQNIVATVNLTCKLDLKHIALRARNAEYNPKVAPAPEFLAISKQNMTCV